MIVVLVANLSQVRMEVMVEMMVVVVLLVVVKLKRKMVELMMIMLLGVTVCWSKIRVLFVAASITIYLVLVIMIVLMVMLVIMARVVPMIIMVVRVVLMGYGHTKGYDNPIKNDLKYLLTVMIVYRKANVVCFYDV